MKQENASAAALALTLYRDCLRKILARHGIECQELDGSFMLAFGNVIEAIKFCVLVWCICHSYACMLDLFCGSKRGSHSSSTALIDCSITSPI